MTGTRTAYAPDIRHGDPVTLVRYVLTRDGWQPELTVGRYRGRTSTDWLLSTGTFPRTEWQACTE